MGKQTWGFVTAPGTWESYEKLRHATTSKMHGVRLFGIRRRENDISHEGRFAKVKGTPSRIKDLLVASAKSHAGAALNWDRVNRASSMTGGDDHGHHGVGTPHRNSQCSWKAPSEPQRFAGDRGAAGKSEWSDSLVRVPIRPVVVGVAAI